MRGLRVLLLGRPRLELDGRAVAAELPLKQQALLYFLAAADGPVGRAELATLLWEDLDEAAARGNLRTALMKLRRTLPGVLAADARQVGFDPAQPPAVDWAALARAAAGEGPPALRRAAADAWRGPLLEGFDLGGDAWSHWLAAARMRAQRQAVALRRSLAADADEAGDADAAEAHWRALLDIDDADEEAHMALMGRLAASGRRTAAIAQYEACRAALRERLGARPSAGCYAMYAAIHADAPRSVPSMPSAAPPSEHAAHARSPEPASPDAGPAPGDAGLIGREEELSLLAERLADAGCHWLTVVGPGGVGKTRLARAAAVLLAPRFRHGMLWISGRDTGGALRDAESLAQRVLACTGGDRDRPGALLLVLDNLETVPDVPALARALRLRAPGVRVLATSRRRLGGPGEWLLELHGLSLAPVPGGGAASSPAARLLATAVQRLDPRFDAGAEADAVDRLCERVGGLPLALELAARGVLDAGLPSVLARLEAGAPLEDGARAGDGSRQHSIALVMEDAWGLLDAGACDAALRLAWLPGEFDLALAAAAGAGAPAVEALRAHSWLRRTAAGGLALHPLQQGFLRQRPQAEALRAGVRAALADGVRAVLPPGAAAFAPWPAESVPPSGPLFAAATLAEALAQELQNPDAQAMAAWVDGVVAVLSASDRHAEAVALLDAAIRRGDLPAWRRAGWQMRRAEALNTLGESVDAMRGYEEALATLDLDRALRAGSGWLDLPGGLWQARRLAGWPVDPGTRRALAVLLARSMMMFTQQLSFTPALERSIRANLLTLALCRRTLGRDHRRAMRVMTAYGLGAAGHRRLSSRVLAAARVREPVADDPMLEAFTREGECATRIALGHWAGVGDELAELTQTMERLGDHRHAMECHSLRAKLLFYQGALVPAADIFAASTERSLCRPGAAWRAWGPFGLAEVAWCLGDADDARLRHWLDLGAHWLTESLNLDAAYTLRRFGLAARLAWRRGDGAAAREAVLAGVAAGARIPHCGFWAHEGFVGLAEVLLALRRHERGLGGAAGPLDEAWRALDARLAVHARAFVPARATLLRLRGDAAMDRGDAVAAGRLWRAAVQAAEAQGMRVELARGCEALARVEPADEWQARAGRLWGDMAAGARLPG